MSAYGDDQIGRVLGARYRLLTAVGSGASATVYQADDVQLRRTVAVKLLHPTLASDSTFLKRFRAEAQAAAGLSHPNVMAVFDWGEDNGTPYLVLEYLAGGSLRAMLDVGRNLSPSQALVVGLEAARGLDYAHKRGVVHRDIKPANLLFGEDGRLRIADFGLARAISEASWTEPDGVMLGTARYASPEQATGQPLDGKSDVYSLALSLVEAVTGVVPFAAETTVATLMARLGKLLPVSADLGPLAPVLERAGRPDPAERYSSGELGQALLTSAEKLSRPEPLRLVITKAPKRHDETVLGLPVDGSPVPSSDVAPGVVPPSAPPAITAESDGVPVDPFAGEDLGIASNGRDDDAEAIAALNLGGSAKKPKRFGRGSLWAMVAAVLLLVGGAAFAVVKTGKETVNIVPALERMPVGVAQNAVSQLGWEVDIKTEKSDDVPERGTVISQNPPANTPLKKGGLLVLTVSGGPKPAKLPDIVKLPVAEAKAALAERQLLYNELPKIFDETAPADTVMSWTVGGQTLPVDSPVEKQTTVDVVVSQGPTPRRVPEVRGMNWEQAKAAIEGVQLKVVREEDVFSDVRAAGTVGHISPGIDTEVPRGSEVKIAISKGPDLVDVPNIYADSLAKAVETLTAAGLVQGTIDGPIDRPVIACDPVPGTKVKRGTAVKIRLG